MNPVLDFIQVVRDFRELGSMRCRRAVDGISVSIEGSSIFGFVGRNGSGKSTVLRIAAGICAPSSGKVLFCGKSIHPSEQGLTLGYLPENPRFPPYLTGRELVRLHAHLCGIRGRIGEECVDEVLHSMGLDLVADLRIRTYSRGTVQRLGIAQACVHSPKLLILDEPTAGLDRGGTKDLLHLLSRLKRQGVSIVMSLHDPAEVIEACDRAAVLERGKLVTVGKPEELFHCTRLLALLVEPVGSEIIEDLRIWLGKRDRKLYSAETVYCSGEKAFPQPQEVTFMRGHDVCRTPARNTE